MRSAQILLHPALPANLDRIVDVSIVIGHSGSARTRKSITSREYGGGETHFISVNRSRIGCRISSHIIGCARLQTRNCTCKRADTAAVVGVIVIESRIVTFAPTDATGDDVAVYIIIYNTTTYGFRKSDIAHRIRGDNGKCGKCHFITIGCTYACSVCTYIISSAWRQPRKGTGKVTRTGTIRRVGIVQSRIGRCAPADTTFGNRIITIGSHRAAASCAIDSQFGNPFSGNLNINSDTVIPNTSDRIAIILTHVTSLNFWIIRTYHTRPNTVVI